MPTVICCNQHVTRWRAQRGNSQPATCPECGEPTKKATYDSEQHCYVALDTKPKLKRQPVMCAVCGHRRMAPSSAVRLVEVDTILLTENWLRPEQIPVPAGAWVCWIHRPLLAK